MITLTIHDANMNQVAWVDNNSQQALNFYDDTWTRDLQTGGSVFEFTVFKKAIKSDAHAAKAYHLLNDQSFISFDYKGESYVFSVMEIEDDEHTIHIVSENLNLELINEKVNAYKATRPMTLVEYLEAMVLVGYGTLDLGINEISDRSRQLEWEGRETKLARLISLANKFDAEFDFRTELNRDGTIKLFVINFYRQNDGKDVQGVGKIRGDLVLRYGDNVKKITRRVDKRDIVNAIQPIGKDGLNILGLSPWKEYNDDGELEFFQQDSALFAPLSMQRYPSVFSANSSGDKWTRGDIDVDTTDKTVLRANAIRELKKLAYPSIEYKIDGFVDADIGDTLTVEDEGFSPKLILSARVARQKISFTDSTKNVTEIANVRALENRLSAGIQSAINDIRNQPSYHIKIETTAGTMFKNGQGESTITPSLYDGILPVSAVNWQFIENGFPEFSDTYTLRAQEIADTATVTIKAFVRGQEVASQELTFVNVNDGADGKDGKDGSQGSLNLLKSSTMHSYNHQLTSTTTARIAGRGQYYLGWQVPLEANTTYTLSLRVVSNDGDDAPYMAVYDKSLAVRKVEPVSITEGKATFTTGSNATNDDQLLIYLTHDKMASYVIEEIQLEKGSKATPWSLNPADLSQKIDEATAAGTKAITEAGEAKAEAQKKLDKVAVSLNANGTVTKAGSVVNGGTYADMIASNASWVQKIGSKIKVNGDMIVNGAISGDKLAVNSLSAITSNLGKITGGEIFISQPAINSKGERVIQQFTMAGGLLNFTMVNTANYSVDETIINGEEIVIRKKNASNEVVKQFIMNDERLQIHGIGASDRKKNLEIGFLNGYTRISADYVENTTAIRQRVRLPYGLVGEFFRVGNVITINIPRKIVALERAEYKLGIEKVPEGYRPEIETAVPVYGNSGASLVGNSIFYFLPDGSIRFTNGTADRIVWSGSMSWVSYDPMPLIDAKDR